MPLNRIYPEKEQTKRFDVNVEDLTEQEIMSYLLSLPDEELEYVDKEILQELLFIFKKVNRMGKTPEGSLKLSAQLKDLVKQAMKSPFLYSGFSNRVGDDGSSLKNLANLINKRLKFQKHLKKDHQKSRQDRLILYKDFQSLLEKLVQIIFLFVIFDFC